MLLPATTHRWQLVVEAGDDQVKESVSLTQKWSKPVSSVPCTRLQMDQSGRFLAVGGSDGAVTVLDTATCSKVVAVR